MRIGRALACLVGLGALVALSPVVPVVETREVVRTRAERIVHARASDFAAGAWTGAMAPGTDPASASLRLVGGDEGSYTSPPVALARPASSVGLHWTLDHDRGAAPAVSLRAGPDGGSWGPWRAIEGEASAPVAGGARVFGTLADAGGARVVQYRVELRGDAPPVRAVELIALDSASAPRRTVARLRLAPTGTARAAIKPLGIVSRAQWGADEALRYRSAVGRPREEIWPEEVTAVEKIVVHHTQVANVCSSTDVVCQRRSVAAINDVYYYHTVSNGWGDIGYNSLIGYDGRIYEGRHAAEPRTGEPLTQAVVGGHALHYNRASHGIALMGDFAREPVPDLQFDALERMVGWIVRSQLAAGGGVDPLGSSDYAPATGQLHRALPNVVGHRDVYAIDCPGEMLYARLDDLRVHAQRMSEWPPVGIRLRARPLAEGVEFRVAIDNHEPDVVRRMTVKGAVPPNAEYVDSWAGTPGSNRGAFDGSTVTWVDPLAKLDPGLDRREYVFVVRPRAGVPRGALDAVAWVEFAEPARGVAVSEHASADQPIVLTVDGVLGHGAGFRGDWPLSRNVAGYYGDAYHLHEPGDPSAYFRWQARLPEPGTYEVLAWWTAARDRASNAPYTVEAADGPHAVRVDQRGRGSEWVSLGRFPFPAGDARVTLTADADNVVIADALRFQQVRP